MVYCFFISISWHFIHRVLFKGGGLGIGNWKLQRYILSFRIKYLFVSGMGCRRYLFILWVGPCSVMDPMDGPCPGARPCNVINLFKSENSSTVQVHWWLDGYLHVPTSRMTKIHTWKYEPKIRWLICLIFDIKLSILQQASPFINVRWFSSDIQQQYGLVGYPTCH